jgi:formylglycine-generating enzyme required for sulfatase activity
MAGTAPRACASITFLVAFGLAGCSPVRPHTGCDPASEQDHVLSGPQQPISNVSPPPTATIGSQWLSPVDRMILVYVPAGTFIMGASSTDPDAFENEKPQHSVYLDAYWIDSTEVTNAMYALCVADGECTSPAEDASFSRSLYYSHPTCGGYPVIQITWQQAHDYCAWAGRRLPTEGEWEKAARGTDGRVFPWGNQAPDGTRANLCGSECPNEANDPAIDDGFFDTAPVGSYPAGASPYGTLDMAGNVWEWVADWGQADYYSVSPAVDPLGPSTGDTRVLRGGAFTSPPQGIRVTNRTFLTPTVPTGEFGGFRCALSVDD